VSLNARSLRGWLIPALGVLLPVLGVIGTAVAGSVHGWPKALLLGGVVLTTAGASLLNVLRERRAARARRRELAAVANLDTAVTGGGQPVVAALGRALLETDVHLARREVDAVLRVALVGVVTHCGNKGSRRRGIYYRLAGDHLERVGDPVGRTAGPAPRARFSPGNGRVDRRVIEVARGEAVIRIEDIRAARPGEFEKYEDREYETVIAAPVRAGGRNFGLLLVDSDLPGSLSEGDAEYVNLIAGMLGAGYAHLFAIAAISDASSLNGKKDNSQEGVNGSTAPQPRQGESTSSDEGNVR
jgi:hypothetical protein